MKEGGEKFIHLMKESRQTKIEYTNKGIGKKGWKNLGERKKEEGKENKGKIKRKKYTEKEGWSR